MAPYRAANGRPFARKAPTRSRRALASKLRIGGTPRCSSLALLYLANGVKPYGLAPPAELLRARNLPPPSLAKSSPQRPIAIAVSKATAGTPLVRPPNAPPSEGRSGDLQLLGRDLRRAVQAIDDMRPVPSYPDP